MFGKTKRNIVFAIVFSLLALMIVTLTTIYLSNRVALRRENEEMLKTYVERYALEEQPTAPEPAEDAGSGEGGQTDGGDLPPPPPDGKEPMRREPQFRLSTFYSVAYGNSGEVLAIRNGNGALQSDASLLETAASILKSGKKSGAKGTLYYLVAERESYTLVAMLDGTIGDRNQTLLIRQMLIIGAVSTAILFVVSIFLARRIVRPLEENDRRQKRFVSDAGHELKTPIAVISANSELLKRQIGENEWLANIDYENRRMCDLVKQLLLLSRVESGETPKETVDLSKLTDGEILPFESLAFERGKRIDATVEPGLTVEGDPNQLRQLVSILLDNALSHGTGDSITLSLFEKERHEATLTVANEAAEPSEEQLTRMFDRFYRTDEARTDAGAHYGLGLSIAQAVTKAHGGRIAAEYRKPRLIFTVTLPQKD